MIKVNIVEKKGKFDLWNVVKFQIITYCYMNNISLSDSEIDCLTLLGINDEIEISDFCNVSCISSKRDRKIENKKEKEIFKNLQTARNCLSKLEKLNLIEKEGKYQKTIRINKSLNIQTKGNILINYKFLYEAKEN
jgi:hypothetical protein